MAAGNTPQAHTHSETRLNTQHAHTQHTHTALRNDQTPGKYIHTKEKTGKTCFFLAERDAAYGGFFFTRISCAPPALKKIEREKRHGSW
jgi:hypothetical protein